MQTVIIAGGRGTRLGKITTKIPKPMIEIGGEPLLLHQILLLKRYGIKNIFILTAYLAEMIENYFGDGKKLGVNIKFLRSDESLGNADRVKLLDGKISDDFLVFYGDVMLDMDLKKLIAFHKTKAGIATLVIHPNDHPYDSDLLETDANDKIVALHPKPHPADVYFKNLVNAGAYVFSPRIFHHIKTRPGIELDFGRRIFPELIKKENVFGYNTPEYIKDMGTPERLKQVRKDYLSGKIARMNSKNKQRAVFLDRDGTINQKADDLYDINVFKLLPGAAKAVKIINQAGYLAILATNQPVIAKGFLTIDGLEEIHKKMQMLLGQEGARLDGIYFCPHHPDRGYPEENSKYTIQCGCRKPQIGMVKKAQNDFNIDLKNSYFIGDSDRDIVGGKNAGAKTIAIGKGADFRKNIATKNRQPDFFAKDLFSAVKLITGRAKS